MVVLKRLCEAIAEGGERCRAQPMRAGSYCFWHDPEHAKDAADARRLGGLRRRRESTVSGAYELDGLADVAGLRRILEIAAVDALSLDNSVARVRVLTTIVQVGARLLEVGDLESRLGELEEVIGPRLPAQRAR